MVNAERKGIGRIEGSCLELFAPDTRIELFDSHTWTGIRPASLAKTSAYGSYWFWIGPLGAVCSKISIFDIIEYCRNLYRVHIAHCSGFYRTNYAIPTSFIELVRYISTSTFYRENHNPTTMTTNQPLSDGIASMKSKLIEEETRQYELQVRRDWTDHFIVVLFLLFSWLLFQ
jgi:hypothetical protein